jgi:hypothetical protein
VWGDETLASPRINSFVGLVVARDMARLMVYVLLKYRD